MSDLKPENYHQIPVDNKLIEELQTQFLEEYAKNPSEYDQKDLERVRSPSDNHWHVRRFLLIQIKDKKISDQQKIVDGALKHMIQAYRWRKSMGVSSITIDQLPKEYFLVAAESLHSKILMFLPYQDDA